jgi:3-deoxy-D-manno-octulosonic-acid transferase
MILIYNSLVSLVAFILPLIAFFNKKIALFVSGRKETFQKLSTLEKTGNIIWMHVASLGEFEQARPIIEELKEKDPTIKIVITFFSPSGYEIRKNYPLADVICYLPLDTKANAKKFIDVLNPSIAIFVKYEFWPNMLNELNRRKIKTVLVSGILRKDQIFFKFYDAFMRKALRAFHHFFVQNQHSKILLRSIHFRNVTVAGDTRFDRVSEILKKDNKLDFITEFKNNQYTVVAGSSWKEDEAFFIHYINQQASEGEKFIIAPHNIDSKAIQELQKAITKKCVLYSEKEGKNLSEYQVLIVDTIGILTKIYSEADAAYVGGGLATGLHNILEPATFGVPIVIGGYKYQKFQEAVDLISLNACIPVKNQTQFSNIFRELYENVDYRKKTGSISGNYIQDNTGATEKIMNYLNTVLDLKNGD